MLDTIICSLSSDEKMVFDQPYSCVDVKATLDNMFIEKAPGPDIMIVAFYKEHWSLLDEDISRVVHNVLNDGGSIKEINDTFIALVIKFLL